VGEASYPTRPGYSPCLRRLLFSSQKGGVGKTASAVNTACALGQSGARVLLVDTDPNSGMAACFGLTVPARHPGLYGVESQRLSSLVIEKIAPNVDALPYARDRRPIDMNVLFCAVAEVGSQAESYYDFVILDTRPSVSNMTRQLCQVVDEVIVIFQCQHLAFRTLSGILTELKAAQADGAQARVLGLLLTMVDLADSGQVQLEGQIRKSLGPALLPTSIPLDASVGEGLLDNQPVVLFRPHAPAAWAYRKLATHLLAMNPIR
jgi:chromosome partitioning protein